MFLRSVKRRLFAGLGALVALAVIFEEVRLIDNIQVQDAGVSDQVEPGS